MTKLHRRVGMEEVMGTGSLEGPTLTLLGFLGTFVMTVFLGTWKARGIQSDLEKQIEEKAIDLRKKASDRHEETLRLTGEGMAALRQKAVDMELWNRDNFVRRVDFQNAVDSFTRSIDNLRADMNGQYTRINDKLDQVIQGKVGPPAPHR